MATAFSGPMFEPAVGDFWESVMRHSRDGKGAHYNTFGLTREENAEPALRRMFPDGQANEMNFVLFSTSGVHGSYQTIEDIESCAAKNGWTDAPEDGSEDEARTASRWLTFLVVQPRTVTLRYGNVRATAENVAWLKKLRETSWAAVAGIGK